MLYLVNFRSPHRDVVDTVELAEAALLLLAAPIWILLPAHSYRWKQATPLAEKRLSSSVKATSRHNRVRINDAVGAVEVCTFICEKTSSATLVTECEARAEPEAINPAATEAEAFAAENLSWWCLLAAVLHSIAMADPIEVRLNVALINKRMQETWSRGNRCDAAEIQSCAQAVRRKRALDRAEAEAQALAEARAEEKAEEERRCRAAVAAARRAAGPVGKYVPPHLRNR